MKKNLFKILVVLGLMVALLFGASKVVFGAEQYVDFVNVTKVTQNQDGSTTVLFERTWVDGNNNEYPMLYYGYVFNGKLSTQNAIDRVSLFVDDHILVRSKLEKVTPRNGQTWALAKKRAEAWQTKGLTGYFAELNKQIQEQGLK